MDINTSNKSIDEAAVVTDTRPQHEDGSADAHADENHKATGALAPSDAIAEGTVSLLSRMALPLTRCGIFSEEYEWGSDDY